MIMKALLMIRYVATKEVTIQALGADHKNETLDPEQGRQHFNRVFQYIKEKDASRPKQPEFTRMIGDEIVGRQLALSTTSIRLAVCPADACLHPDSSMVRRGNAKERDGIKTHCLWWTCLLCHSRWERCPATTPPDDKIPCDSDRVLFGKHNGKTFREVYDNYPTYCNWVIETQEQGESPSPQLLYFAKYLLFHAPHEPPASIRVAQQEAQEQAYGPLGPQRPQVLPPQPPIQQQAQLAWQQQWVQYTEEEQQAIAAANYEHLKSANVDMYDDDMKEL